MRDIARLLFGDDAGKVLGFFGGGDGDGFGMAERARRAGEWCGSTPGRGTATQYNQPTAKPGSTTIIGGA